MSLDNWIHYVRRIGFRRDLYRRCPTWNLIWDLGLGVECIHCFDRQGPSPYDDHVKNIWIVDFLIFSNNLKHYVPTKSISRKCLSSLRSMFGFFCTIKRVRLYAMASQVNWLRCHRGENNDVWLLTRWIIRQRDEIICHMIRFIFIVQWLIGKFHMGFATIATFIWLSQVNRW